MKISVVASDKKIIELLQKQAISCGVSIKGEVQLNNKIENKLTIDDIMDSDAVLFSVNNPVEEIEDIERFIDLEYYEVEPNIVISSPDIVLKEIIEDIK